MIKDKHDMRHQIKKKLFEEGDKCKIGVEVLEIFPNINCIQIGIKGETSMRRDLKIFKVLPPSSEW